MRQRLQPYVPQVSLLVVGMVTPNSMQFVTREAARIDGFMSAAGDALFQTGFVDPIVAAAYGGGFQAAAAAVRRHQPPASLRPCTWPPSPYPSP